MGIEDQAAADAFASGYDDQPTATPAKEVEPAAKEAKDEPKPDAAVAEPIKDAAPVTLESLLERMEKFEQGQSKNSDKLFGHIGRLERGYREIQTNMATGQAAAKTVDDAPSQSAIKAAADDPAEWSTLKQQYPEWAAATEKMVAARAPSFDANAFEQKVNAAIEGKTAEMQARIIDVSLNAVYPGWRKTVAAPEFVAWMDAQPDDIQQTRYSDDVGDVVKTLKLYEASKTAPPATAPAAPKEPSPREKRLAAAVAPKGTGGHAPGRSDLDEFEAGYSG